MEGKKRTAFDENKVMLGLTEDLRVDMISGVSDSRGIKGSSFLSISTHSCFWNQARKPIVVNRVPRWFMKAAKPL